MFIFNFIVNKGGKEEESNRVLEHRDPTMSHHLFVASLNLYIFVFAMVYWGFQLSNVYSLTAQFNKNLKSLQNAS